MPEGGGARKARRQL